MPVACPTNRRIQEFLDGNIPEDEATVIAEHFDTCESCDNTVTSMECASLDVFAVAKESINLKHVFNEPEYQKVKKAALQWKNECFDTDDISSKNRVPEKRCFRDYRLLKKIGEGGMGTVYHAVHRHLLKPVALKILSPEKMQSEQAVQRFRQEIRAVGKLNHPNVVSASDAGDDNGTQFLVMELIIGSDLSQIVSKLGPLPVENACEIIRQAALGLHHAHENGLVHRDIKPSNVMLDSSGSVKLLDLGLAGLHDLAGNSTLELPTSRLTSFGQIMGTLDYMAPEQMDLCADVSTSADIFALGASLFHLLTGRSPFPDRSTGLENGGLEDAIDTSNIRSEIPTKLSMLLSSMLARDPNERPTSALVVADALSEFCCNSRLDELAKQCPQRAADSSVDASLIVQSEPVISIPQVQALEDLNERKQRLLTRSVKPWWRRQIKQTVAIILSLLLLAWIGSFSISAWLKEGIVQIKLNEDATNSSIQLVVEKDGKQVCSIDPKTVNQLTLPVGKYLVRLESIDDRIELSSDTLEIETNKISTVSIVFSPDTTPEELFKKKQVDKAIELAEKLVNKNPDLGWNHARAAMFHSFAAPGNGESLSKFRAHRRWLLDRWSKTKEGPNTIPRICCLAPDFSNAYSDMLKTVAEEEKQKANDWRLPHSRMMLAYRLNDLDQAQMAFAKCRVVSPNNKMHHAVDSAWAALIQFRLDNIEEAKQHYKKALDFQQECKKTNGAELPSMWFDYIELSVVLRELHGYRHHMQGIIEPTIRSFPFSAVHEDFKLAKWREISKEITDADISTDGSRVVAGIGWRPGTWETWDVDIADENNLLVDYNKVTRHIGGQPVRSVAIHPGNNIAAIGRWYGRTDVVEVIAGRLLSTRTTAVGKLRKSNSVEFINNGDHLKIGYQSKRAVIWDWNNRKDLELQVSKKAVWEAPISPSQNRVILGDQIWDTSSNVFVDVTLPESKPTDKVSATIWSPDGSRILRTINSEVVVYDSFNGSEVHRYKFNKNAVRIAHFKAAPRIIIGFNDGEMKLLDLTNGERIHLGRLHSNHGFRNLELCKNDSVLLATTGKRLNKRLTAHHQIAIWNIFPGLATKPLKELQSQMPMAMQTKRKQERQLLEELRKAQLDDER